MVDFIAGSIDFIFKYLVQIILVILILVLMMVYMTVHNVHFKKKHIHLQRIVEIEGFECAKAGKYPTCFAPQRCATDGVLRQTCTNVKRQADTTSQHPNSWPWKEACWRLGRDPCARSPCCGWAAQQGNKNCQRCVPVRTVKSGGQTVPLGMVDRKSALDVDSLYFRWKEIDI